MLKCNSAVDTTYNSKFKIVYFILYLILFLACDKNWLVLNIYVHCHISCQLTTLLSKSEYLFCQVNYEINNPLRQTHYHLKCVLAMSVVIKYGSKCLRTLLIIHDGLHEWVGGEGPIIPVINKYPYSKVILSQLTQQSYN